jgi:hypothetical protein
MARVLACFDGQRSLSEVAELLDQRLVPFAVDVVVWLLRRRMLSEVHSYLYCVDPTRDLAADDPPSERGSTRALQPYCDGSTPLCEVMWREQLSEAQLEHFLASKGAWVVRTTR